MPRRAPSVVSFLALAPLFGCAGPEASPTALANAGPGVPSARDGETAPGFPQYPTLSPDGAITVFTWAGDLWAVPTSGGAAMRLTAHPALERRAAFSPDGSLLAFESDRDGARNIYVMSVRKDGAGAVVGGAVRRVTTSDRAENLSGFTPDGKSIVFSGNREPVSSREGRMYLVSVDGGPVTRLSDAMGSMPHFAGNRAEYVFTRGRQDMTRPKYRGSGDTDIYRCTTAAGGAETFTRLTSFNGSDAEAFLRPDGSVVYISSRSGQNNLWMLPAGAVDDKAPRQLTRFEPAAKQATIGHGARDLSASADGRTAVFAVWDTLYRLDLTRENAAPEAITVSCDADGNDGDTLRLNLDKQVSEVALSPDGKTVALVARGEIFVRSVDEGRPTRRVTDSPWRDRDIAWSPDGRVLYFANDSTGVYAIYGATVALTREQITEAAKPKADAKPEAKPDGKPDAKADVKPETKPKKVDHGKQWADALRFAIDPVAETKGVDAQGPLPSPDGKSLLFQRGLGDLILLDLEAKSQRVIFEGWNLGRVLWMPDSRHIVYAREDLDFNSDIWVQDVSAAAGTPEAAAVNLTRHPDFDTSPALSADGKVLVFLSDRAGENESFDVYALNLDAKLDGLRAYELEEYSKKAVEAAKKRRPLGSEDKAKPDAEKKDGEKKDESKKDEAKKEEPKKDDAKKDEPKDGEKKDDDAKAKPEPLKLDLKDAYLRVRRFIALPGSESDLAITPGGDRIIFSGQVDGKTNFLSVDYKGEDRKVIDVASVSGVGVSLTGDKVTYVKAGVGSGAPPIGGKAESWAIDAPVVIRVADQQKQKFLEAARILGTQFYHPTLKGLDWSALTNTYLELAMRTRTSEEFNRVVMNLLGELDGSHVGISGGGGFTAPSPAIGYLGVNTQAAPGGWKVTRVITGGPAWRDTSRLEEGDLITAIDGRSLMGENAQGLPIVDLTTALAGRAGRETLVEIKRAGDSRLVLLTPTTSAEDVDLRYRDETLRRRDLVESLSKGRLGYLHIRGMSEPYVRDFERDLFAAADGKQGLIIDVRDNGGGSTADILLSSLTAPDHATTVPRGADKARVPKGSYPRDRRLIYSFTRPMNVLINQGAFSNAEIFAHSIKTIGRGKLVGVATYGGVISTGAASLIDGTTVRTPFRGWYLPDGTDMENHGAQPDVPAEQTPEAEAAGRDLQIEAAVKELLGRIGG